MSLEGALGQLDAVLDQAFGELGAVLGEASKSSDFASTEYSVVERRFERRLQVALRRYSDGKIDAAELEDEWATAIADAYPKAFELGAKQWEGSIDEDDRAWLEAAVRSEAGYASNFVSQLEDGSQAVGPSAEIRLGMYVDALESVRTAAWVMKAPEDTLFAWVSMADGSVCVDCTILDAHSPYLRDRTPCQPKSGCCRCLSRCRCRLEIVGTSDTPVSPKVTDLEASASGVTRDGQEPSAEDRARIDDLRAQINYQRRRISSATTDAEREAAIAARKQANKELVDFERERGIRSVPMLSVGDVLAGTDLSPEVLAGTLARGIDGATLSLSAAADARAAADDMVARIGQLLR